MYPDQLYMNMREFNHMYKTLDEQEGYGNFIPTPFYLNF